MSSGEKKATWRRYRIPDVDDIQRESHDELGQPLPTPTEQVAPKTPGRSSSRAPLAVGAAVVIAAAGAGAYVAIDGTSDEDESIVVLEEWQPTPVMTKADLDRILRHVEAETGSTEVLLLRFTRGANNSTPEVGDPYTSAFITVPPTGDGQFGDLAVTYQYGDGELDGQQADETELTETFDLAELDLDAVAGVQDQAIEESGNPVGYADLRIGQPVGPYDSWLQVSVTETDRDEVTIEATLDGTCEQVVLDDDSEEERTEKAC